MQLPKISVVVPAYNGELTIKECLLSILGSNYDNNSIELIVVNDGSEDNTKNIVKDLSSQYKEIKLVSQSNKGAAGARDTGIKTASGEFIFIISQDTFADKNWFRMAVNAFLLNHNIGVIQGKIELKGQIQTPFYHAVQVLKPNINFPTVAIAYRSEALDKAGRYFDSRLSEYGDDTDIAWRILSAGYTFKWLDTITAYHGVYPIKNGLIYNLKRSYPGPEAFALLVKKNPGMKSGFVVPFIWGHPIRILYVYSVLLGILSLTVNSNLGLIIIIFAIAIGFAKNIYQIRRTKLSPLYKWFLLPLINYLCEFTGTLAILKGAIKYRYFLL
ncbi:MAG: Poly-beta-1,6-N-acetyl-D-glucosamine synthase [candidate division WS2 bacterium]|nr:Poly-beta-1,6-N-acetyl-D-glucosamine synthase [Candidatus Lithacetigena glycinireducens]